MTAYGPGSPPVAMPVTIANGTSLSNAQRFDGTTLVGIVMPSSWTAANLTFQVSHDSGTTWNNLYDQSGNEVTVTAAVSRFITLDPASFGGLSYIKVRSGPAATAVNQAADRTVVLVSRAIL